MGEACRRALEKLGVEGVLLRKDSGAVMQTCAGQPDGVLLDIFMRPQMDAIAVKKQFNTEGGRAQFLPQPRSRMKELEEGLLQNGFTCYLSSLF